MTLVRGEGLLLAAVVAGLLLSLIPVVGIWTRKRWGWTFALVLSALDILFGLINVRLFPAASVLQVALGLSIGILLLMDSSRDWVGAR